MRTAAYIPASVERAILAKRDADRRENERLDAEFEERRKREPQHLVNRHDEHPNSLDIEREFWLFAEDDELEEFLFQELLNALFPAFKDHEWATLPKGYKPLIDVLEFERHFDFEGWTAVSNEGADQMHDIVAAYKFFGMVKEAKALAAVQKAYERMPDDESKEFYDNMERAYRSVTNKGRESGKRVERICKFIRKHPAYFAHQP